MMKKKYETMGFTAITVDAANPILAQSGKAGARIMVEATVEEWKDFNTAANPFETKLEPNGNPFEF